MTTARRVGLGLGLLLAAGFLLTPPEATAAGAGHTIPDDLTIDANGLTGGKDALMCLALNDYWEARGETLRGRLAVAMVVMNRVADPRYPDSVCAVVHQHMVPDQPRACQFSWTCDGRPDTPTDEDAWRRSLQLAAAVLEADGALEDPAHGALWYHATHVTPAWTDHLARAEVIGRHVFYRDRPPFPEPRPEIEIADLSDGGAFVGP